MDRKEVEIMIRRHMRRIDDLAVECDPPLHTLVMVVLGGEGDPVSVLINKDGKEERV